jgi:hypothetical protein
MSASPYELVRDPRDEHYQQAHQREHEYYIINISAVRKHHDPEYIFKYFYHYFASILSFVRGYNQNQLHYIP